MILGVKGPRLSKLGQFRVSVRVYTLAWDTRMDSENVGLAFLAP